MGREGSALQPLRACNVSPQQMVQFLQPFNGRLPHDENEFGMMVAQMRRIGHILERSPNNLGQLLHHNQQARSGEYFTQGTYSGGEGRTSEPSGGQPSEPSSDPHPATPWG